MVLNLKDVPAHVVGVEVRRGVEVATRFTVILCETLVVDMFNGYEYICGKTDACRENHTKSQIVWDKKS